MTTRFEEFRLDLHGDEERVLEALGDTTIRLRSSSSFDYAEGAIWLYGSQLCRGDLHREEKVDEEGGTDVGDEEPAPDVPDRALSVEEAQAATWLVAAGSDYSFGTATAFGVGSDLLATNAHVVEGILAAAAEPNGGAIVVQHETGEMRNVTTVWMHPDFVSDAFAFTPHIGLLEVDEEIPSFLSLADTETVRSLEVFDEVSLCGFPGDVTLGIDFVGIFTGEFRPRVTCLNGTISALRPFDPGEAATAENRHLIQYDLPVVPGTSGSAVFNDAGEVVGVNSFGFFQSGGDFNFAIRADKLAELIESVTGGGPPGTDLADLSAAPPDDGSPGTLPTGPCET
ncbi:MAG: trypsin-like peptidase domain-containing protein, partial [Planctomycetota bacterium]